VTLVYDPDGLNPYGRELAALLTASGRPATALTAYDAEWLPAGTRNVLPANRSRPGRIRQGVRLLHGLVLVAAAVVRRRTVVVVLTRSFLDEAVLGLLGFVGRVVVVVHDPTPKQPPAAWRRRSHALLLRGASVRVAHSAALAAEVGRGARVVRHLPFLTWCADLGVTEAGGGALLVLGHLRPDKGLDRLPAALARPAGAAAARLVVCGRGPLDRAVRAALAGVVTVDDRAGTVFATDAEVARALTDASVMVAPYRVVSQSGSVALAASARRAVVAYDTGALADLPGVVTVPDGDAEAFGNAVYAALSGPPPATDVDAWAAGAAAEWLAALD
jgi:glycosyltransferase involved in cell wall biosynthesis